MRADGDACGATGIAAEPPTRIGTRSVYLCSRRRGGSSRVAEPPRQFVREVC